MDNLRLAVWRLAAAHGHEWAADANTLQCFGADGVAPLDDVERVYQEWMRTTPDNGLPAGLPPALSHVTGTGRVAWSQSAWRNEVTLEVHRPSMLVGGLYGGTIPVLRAVVSVRADGTALTVSPLQSSPLAEDRHYRAMLQLLDVLEADSAEEPDPPPPMDDAWTTCVRRLTPAYCAHDITRAYWSGVRDGAIEDSVAVDLEWQDGRWVEHGDSGPSRDSILARYAIAE